MNETDIQCLNNEINSIQCILENSINAHYGMSNELPLTKEEHYIFWDRMWQLMKGIN